MKPRFLIAALAAACVSQPAHVWAQAFLSDPRLTDGMGVKAGDFEFHPGVAAEGGYDSNYYQASGDQTDTVHEPKVGAYRLRITPSLSFVSTGRREIDEGGGPQPALRLRGQLAASYNALVASESRYSDQVSKNNNLSGTAGLGAEILPGHTWGGDIAADYTRILEASNDVDVGNAWRRDIVRGAAGLVWRPGGGLFKWRLGYGLKATVFEDEGYQDLNNLQHSLVTNGDWKFLPRTALVYRGNVTWLHYTNNQPTLGNGASVDTEIGLNGLISNYFGVLGLIGWGATFYEPKSGRPENFDSVVGQAEVTWYPSPQKALPEGTAPVGLSSVSLGYRRSFSPSYLGQYYQRDRGYLNTTYFFAQQFVLALSGGVSRIGRPPSYFPGAPTNPGPQDIQFGGGGEARVDALAFLEYRPGPSVGINATFRYDAELTSRLINLDPTGATQDQLKFDRYQVFLGVRWFL